MPLTVAQAQAFISQLAEYDEALLQGTELRLRLCRWAVDWLEDQALPRAFAAAAALGVTQLRLELRTFHELRDELWTQLEAAPLQALQRLDLGLVYRAPPASRLAALRAKYPRLEILSTRAMTPRMSWRDETRPGSGGEEPLRAGSGLMMNFRAPRPNESPFDLPALGAMYQDGVGVTLRCEKFPEGERLTLNGKEVDPAIPLVLVDSDVLQAGTMQLTIHESANAETPAARPVSPALEALRAQRPPPEERSLGGRQFFRLADRTLATALPDGQLLRFPRAAGREELVQLAALLDPSAGLATEDARWLIEHFDGWSLVHGNPASVKEWLINDGVGRSTLFVNDEALLRVQVGRTVQAPLQVSGELLTLAVARRGEVNVELHEQDAFEAPPLFHALAERIGAENAGALWRFPHFRKNNGRLIPTGASVARIDAGPFTWIVLEADGWLMEVTAVGGKALELNRRRKDGPMSGLEEPGRAAATRLTYLLRTVELARVTDEDVLALVPMLGVGALVAANPRGENGRLVFVTRGPSEFGGEEEVTFTVDFEREPRVQYVARPVGRERVKGT